MSENLGEDMAEALRRQISAERDLSKRLLEHAGEWVAVRNHEVVAHAPTLEELMESISGEDEQEQVEVFEVATEPNSVCFF
jgi:phosphohistidine phosphatase SixA